MSRACEAGGKVLAADPWLGAARRKLCLRANNPASNAGYDVNNTVDNCATGKPRSYGPFSRSWAPFLEGPEKFSGPESHNKNRKPYVSRAGLFTYFKYVHCFIVEIQIIKNGFTGPISCRVFQETGPRRHTFSLKLLNPPNTDSPLTKTLHLFAIVGFSAQICTMYPMRLKTS